MKPFTIIKAVLLIILLVVIVYYLALYYKESQWLAKANSLKARQNVPEFGAQPQGKWGRIVQNEMNIIYNF